jgi:type 2 lantibiotic biosynthesis protein LanM
LLAASAREDQRRTLGRFLARLLLLGLGEASLQKAIDHWVDAQLEMLARLRADWAAISAWGGDGPLACKVRRVEGELSDRHDGGRSAAILTFESGWKVVYKPRAMQADAWYSRLLDWLNALEAPVSFRSPRVLARDGYGWMEFVAHRRCRSRAELSEYHRNAGGLLCLLYLLRATDCHFQNLIACGVDPVLVDAEMLFQPSLQASDAWTVTRTGLIPNFRFGPGGETYDVSGLGFVRPRPTHFEVPEWSESGVQFRPGWLAPTKNVPFGEDAEARPHLFVAEIESGFLEMHRFAERRREGLLEQVESAREVRVRYLVRETMEYYAAWKHENGSSIYLGELQPSYAIFSGLVVEELAALGRFDVPRFTLAAESRDLHGVRGCFAASGYELALSGIRELGEKDRDLQMGQMRVAWGFARLASALA